MKNAFFFITVILIAFSSNAQGRLQFNQVVTMSMDTSFVTYGFGTHYYFDLYSVPAEKVVKVVVTSSIVNSDGSYSCDGISFNFTHNSIVSSLNGAWLESGDIIGGRASTHGNHQTDICNLNTEFFISLIEYNIIPE